jgi:hypothetical protein
MPKLGRHAGGTPAAAISPRMPQKKPQANHWRPLRPFSFAKYADKTPQMTQ